LRFCRVKGGNSEIQLWADWIEIRECGRWRELRHQWPQVFVRCPPPSLWEFQRRQSKIALNRSPLAQPSGRLWLDLLTVQRPKGPLIHHRERIVRSVSRTPEEFAAGPKRQPRTRPGRRLFFLHRPSSPPAIDDPENLNNLTSVAHIPSSDSDSISFARGRGATQKRIPRKPFPKQLTKSSSFCSHHGQGEQQSAESAHEGGAKGQSRPSVGCVSFC